ncbi:MAG: hypothetical protein QM785_18985 [Pyrinomonadaceae bacterium]
MGLTTISAIKDQVKNLPAEQKAELIKFLADQLADKPQRSSIVEFGKYANSGRRMSTEDDFKIAEWRPSDEELNGN